MASRQAVGESLPMSNTYGSAYPGTTIRAEAFVSEGVLSCALSTNRNCSTRYCKPCFLSVRQMTLASAGGITVAAVFLPCIPLFVNGLKEQQLLAPIQAMPLLFF